MAEKTLSYRIWRDRARRLIVAITAGFITGFILPAYIIPAILETMGITGLKGISGLSISIEHLPTVPMPLPVLETPDSFIIAGFLPGGVSTALYLYLRSKYREKSRLKKQLGEFIPLVASYVRTGMSLLRALEVSAGVIKEPLADYVERFARLIRLGEDPAEAFERVFRGSPREVRSILSSVVIAMASGGRVAEVLSRADQYVTQLNRMDDLRRYQLENYKLMLIMAVLGFALTAIVTLWLLSSMAHVSVELPGIKSVSVNLVATSYFITSLLLIVMSSIVTSRIVYDTSVLAAKYMSILFPVISLAFAIFFLII